MGVRRNHRCQKHIGSVITLSARMGRRKFHSAGLNLEYLIKDCVVNRYKTKHSVPDFDKLALNLLTFSWHSVTYPTVGLLYMKKYLMISCSTDSKWYVNSALWLTFLWTTYCTSAHSIINCKGGIECPRTFLIVYPIALKKLKSPKTINVDLMVMLQTKTYLSSEDHEWLN